LTAYLFFLKASFFPSRKRHLETRDFRALKINLKGSAIPEVVTTYNIP
jgi:hypothetical protein